MAKRIDNPVQRIQRLARSFPSLERAVGIEPWNPHQLDLWAHELFLHPGCIASRHAAQFILDVWDSDVKFLSGSFSVVQSMPKWKTGDQQAFIAWCQKPWRRRT